MYGGIFSRRAERAYLKLQQREAKRIKEAIIKLQNEPRCAGTIKLENAPVGVYRYRVGNYRIIFDINDNHKVLEILDITKRDERTYK
ncbi:type II toxin-antitoxin system RelE/ParE family toxin [Candidatus Oleimmundimicrobium sp.]|uniref:type II toxin-antitoxin system RelE family toxin n=1 Tax=Candidatus Oleimmundimicrobium sp. TaxID=3060597 RepID=UPI00271B205E|nr:type II toxin-antitoxin system RelE/ParE family toxin [Candidatus Oleimmundimicrobium sp.]MDO8886336.1 type II toxin-antitoxin system RelE/ParE family toxin [Candidatus Oleimmundimicrobium sp.]